MHDKTDKEDLSLSPGKGRNSFFFLELVLLYGLLFIVCFLFQLFDCLLLVPVLYRGTELECGGYSFVSRESRES